MSTLPILETNEVTPASTAPAVNAMPKGKSSKSKRMRDTKRYEAKRSFENNKTISKTNKSLDDKYLVDNREELQAILQREIQYKQQVQISTRGAGVAVVATVATIKTLKTPLPEQAVPYRQLYRVMLALMHSKLAKVLAEKGSGLLGSDHQRSIRADGEMDAILATLKKVPRICAGYIDNLGYFTTDALDYVPVLQADRYNTEGLLIPDAGKVCFKNLRDTVVSLANVGMNAATRRRFMQENSIPGATFNAQAILTNANDIIPAVYTMDHLEADVKAVNIFFRQIDKGAATWLVERPDLSSGKGSPAVSVTMARHMAIVSEGGYPALGEDGLIGVTSTRVYTTVRLKPMEWAMGSAGFYREPPNHARDRYPFWEGCSPETMPFHADINPRNSIRVVYNMEA